MKTKLLPPSRLARRRRSDTLSSGGTDNTVIIGLDFRTTFSGVAFTWSKKLLPPSRLEFRWGYNIPAADEQAKWFKLLLLDDNDLPEEVRKVISDWESVMHSNFDGDKAPTTISFGGQMGLQHRSR